MALALGIIGSFQVVLAQSTNGQDPSDANASAGSLPPPLSCSARFDLRPRGQTAQRAGAPFVINAEEVDLARIGQSEFVGQFVCKRRFNRP